MFCMSLLKKANRDEFKADEAKYLDQYKLTSAQREAILKRQWNGCWSSAATSILPPNLARPTASRFNKSPPS